MSLQYLDLPSPHLTGRLPPELGMLKQLRSLRLTSEGFGRVGLNGNVPAELGNLRNLETLVLSWNQLSGSIPAALGNSSSLKDLVLSINQLLAAFPVADLNQPPPSPILFPQIADGDGFVTQFILLSAAGPSSTTLSLFDETGKPLAIGKW